MAESAKNSQRKSKVDRFKADAKKQSEQQAIPKTHLIPFTEWNSKDTLELRGDLLEALENQMVETFEALKEARALVQVAGENFNKVASVIQMVMAHNIKAEKIKLRYTWNNGEEATEADVKEYEDQVAKLREIQKKKFEEAQAKENASKTGLVGPDGRPVGSSQPLDSVEEAEIVSEETNTEEKNLEGIADQSRAAAETDEGDNWSNEDVERTGALAD